MASSTLDTLIGRIPEALQSRVDGYAASPVTTGQSGGTVLQLSAPDRPTWYLKAGRDEVARDISEEMHRLTWLTSRVAVPQLVHFVRDAEQAVLVTTALPGVPAAAWLAQHPARAPEALRAIASFLRGLHALPVPQCPFDASHCVRLAAARARVDQGVVDEDDFDDARLGQTAEQVWQDMMAMLPLPFERVVTHGDFSLDNIFLDDGQVSGCLDVGRLGVADPYQDVAILWNSLAEYGEALQATWLDAYGAVPPDTERLRFHCCLDEFF
jgi:aminoglycoside 3'-phosphotransferase I